MTDFGIGGSAPGGGSGFNFGGGSSITSAGGGGATSILSGGGGGLSSGAGSIIGAGITAVAGLFGGLFSSGAAAEREKRELKRRAIERSADRQSAAVDRLTQGQQTALQGLTSSFGKALL